MRHLASEGLAERSVLVADVITDVLLDTARRVRAMPVACPIFTAEPYVVATIHRPDNTDNPDRLAAILDALGSLERMVFLAAHPRLVAKAEVHNLKLTRASITPVTPLSYPQLVQAVISASAVVTDSGGLQKEAFLLGTPTTTIRSETEWVETLHGDWNQLVNDRAGVRSSVNRPAPTADRGTLYGDGMTAAATVRVLTERIDS